MIVIVIHHFPYFAGTQNIENNGKKMMDGGVAPASLDIMFK